VIAEGQRVFRFEAFGDEHVWDRHASPERGRREAGGSQDCAERLTRNALPAGILDNVDPTSPATTVALVEDVHVIDATGGATSERETGVHILRHTFCSHLAMRGAPARAIQELAVIRISGRRSATCT
jgi:hypothetical protein